MPGHHVSAKRGSFMAEAIREVRSKRHRNWHRRRLHAWPIERHHLFERQSSR